jgi:hypothetical protein
MDGWGVYCISLCPNARSVISIIVRDWLDLLFVLVRPKFLLQLASLEGAAVGSFVCSR